MRLLVGAKFGDRDVAGEEACITMVGGVHGEGVDSTLLRRPFSLLNAGLDIIDDRDGPADEACGCDKDCSGY